jgi:hypothetical protein
MMSGIPTVKNSRSCSGAEGRRSPVLLIVVWNSVCDTGIAWSTHPQRWAPIIQADVSSCAAGLWHLVIEKSMGMSIERMAIPEDGELSTRISSPPPLAEAVVRATTAFDRAVGVEPPWMSHA